MRKKYINEKGLTLIEVLVASLILIICMTAVMDTFAGGSKFRKNTENATVSLFLAQGLMETTLSLAFSQISPAEGNFNEPYNNFKYKIEVRDISDTLKKVSIKIITPGFGFNKTIELEALKTLLSD